MGEMRYSKLLQVLMKSAVEIGPGQNAPFTAERFLIAVLDMFMHDIRVFGNKEMNHVVERLNTCICGRETAREKLYAYVCRESEGSDNDVRYINGILAELRQMELEVLTADALLHQITSNPSEPIKKLLCSSGEGPIINDAMGRLDWAIKKLDGMIAKAKNRSL